MLSERDVRFSRELPVIPEIDLVASAIGPAAHVRHPHLDHGYAVTSYSSQGQTADRVLINVDTELGAKDLLNNRMAYVSVSRGQWDAQIFTNDREKLSQALGHDVSHQSAHTADLKPPQHEIAETPKQEKSQGMDIGLSL